MPVTRHTTLRRPAIALAAMGRGGEPGHQHDLRRQPPERHSHVDRRPHQSMGKGSSVSPVAVEYCGQHDISVIAGACPMMYGEGADFGHTCMRWILKLTGGLPA